MTLAPQQRPILALALRLGAAFMISLLVALVKLAQESGVSLPEILFWRQMPTVPMLLIWFAWTGQMKLLRTKRLGSHAMRATIGLVSMACNFGAVILLPLAEATAITFTSAIWAVILSALFLREHVGVWRWGAVALGFAGILIITQPGSGEIPWLGAMVAMTAALLIAIISILIRDLGRTEQPLTIVFYFSLFSIPALGVLLPFFSTSHMGSQWLLLAGIAVTGMLGQFLLTAALRLGAVASVMVMDYTALLWATLFGWGIFDRLPPASTWIGGPVVVIAGLLIAWREHRLSFSKETSITSPPGNLNP